MHLLRSNESPLEWLEIKTATQRSVTHFVLLAGVAERQPVLLSEATCVILDNEEASA